MQTHRGRERKREKRSSVFDLFKMSYEEILARKKTPKTFVLTLRTDEWETNILIGKTGSCHSRFLRVVCLLLPLFVHTLILSLVDL